MLLQAIWHLKTTPSVPLESCSESISSFAVLWRNSCYNVSTSQRAICSHEESYLAHEPCVPNHWTRASCKNLFLDLYPRFHTELQALFECVCICDSILFWGISSILAAILEVMYLPMLEVYGCFAMDHCMDQY